MGLGNWAFPHEGATWSGENMSVGSDYGTCNLLEKISHRTSGSNKSQVRNDCHKSLKKKKGLALEKQVIGCEDINNLTLHA